MKKPILFLFILLYINSFACLNLYFSVDHEGHLHEITDFHETFRRFNKNFNLKRIQDKLEKLQLELENEGHYQLLSDYAVLLMKAGEVELSRDLLISLYHSHPDEYQLAANLGTAYELCGEVDSALKYIEKGIELNPNAHEGSEWVHIRILKTKQELQLDSNYLEKNTVLQLSENDENDSLVLNQIFIQVHERFPFSPGPKDPIMASLLVDLGDCFANIMSIEYAKAIYTLAKNYYGDDSPSTQKKIDMMISKRMEFNPIQPERHVYLQGEVIKLSGISQSRMLDDNNKNNFEIDWSRIQLNTDTLLNWANVTPFVIEVEDSIAPGPIAIVDETIEGPVLGETQSNYWLWIVVICCILPPLFVLLYRKKRNQ